MVAENEPAVTPAVSHPANQQQSPWPIASSSSLSSAAAAEVSEALKITPASGGGLEHHHQQALDMRYEACIGVEYARSLFIEP